MKQRTDSEEAQTEAFAKICQGLEVGQEDGLGKACAARGVQDPGDLLAFPGWISI